MSDPQTPTNGDNLIGKTIGQYTILEEIGRGGMATVYSAMQSSMNRKVAIKVLPRHFLHDPGFLERFEREVEVISRLEHPHILPIYDFGDADGVPFIAMRYLGGGSMAQMIRRGVPDLDDIQKPFSQVAQALDYAHQQGVIHRDLKPGNIMLDESGNAYLSDFGIARVMGSDLTGSAIIGTPAYMSPEQAHGLAIDARSDVYALGIVLFELLTGREPYQSETPMGVLLMHVNEPMPVVRSYREDIPDSVEDVIQQATAKDPDERYASAGELAKAFAEALRNPNQTTRSAKTRAVEQATIAPSGALKNQGGTLIGDGVSAPMPTPVPTTAGASMATDASATAVPAPSRGGRGVAIILFLIVIVAIAIVGVLVAPSLLNDNASSATPTPQVAIVPTPFSRAETVQTELYTISMPQLWMPELADFNRVQASEGVRHFWMNDDNSVRVDLWVVDDDIIGDGFVLEDNAPRLANMSARVANLTPETMRDMLIDTATAENGTVRRSYRVEAGSGYEAGQFDFFYRIMDSGDLSMLSFYTADSVANDATVLQTLQLILDSYRAGIDT
jgi:serine/threonine protein kinase